MPKSPIVLAHGLLGFAELKLGGALLPPIHYWRGIKEALEAGGTEVITATVPPSGSIQQRAAALQREIASQAPGRPVNIVAHSMGGLDARYMISRLGRTTTTTHPGHRERASAEARADVRVRALVTVGTPHHGSAFADHLLAAIGPQRLPRVYDVWERTTGWGTGAFAQLTRRYMREEFNPGTPDAPGVRYFSYGAMLSRRPPLLSPFRRSYQIVREVEGPNDGMVSVESARWGTYKGTLEEVSHLDLINWTNRLRWTLRKWMGEKDPFNAIAFYCQIADMLEKEGL